MLERCTESPIYFKSGQPGLVVELLPDDLDAMWLVEQSASAYHWSYQNLKSSLDGDDWCIGVKVDGVLCAHLIVAEQFDVFEILMLSVGAAYQRRGIAKALLQRFLRSANGKSQSLLLEVRASNRAAIQLYKSLGFVEQGRRKNYYAIPAPAPAPALSSIRSQTLTSSSVAIKSKREDAVLMSCALT